jgi:hypothetical protein
MGAIATVENMYGCAQRTSLSAPMVKPTGGEEGGFVCRPTASAHSVFLSLLHGLPKGGAKLAEVARKHTAFRPAQRAWLLHRCLGCCRFSGRRRWRGARKPGGGNVSLAQKDMAYLG